MGRSRLRRRRLPQPGRPAAPGRIPRPFLSAPPREEWSFATLPYGRAAGSAEPGVSPRSRSPLVGRRRGACRARGGLSLRCARSWEPRLPPCSAGPPPPGASSRPRPARRPAPPSRQPAGGGGGRRRRRAQKPPPEPGSAQRCPPRRGARCCCCRPTPPASAPSRVSDPRPRAARGPGPAERGGGGPDPPAGGRGGRGDGWPWAGAAPAGGERGCGARRNGAGFVPRGDAALGTAGGRRRSARAAAAGPALRGAEPGGRPHVARGLRRGPVCGPAATDTVPRGLLARGVGPFVLCGVLYCLRIDAGSLRAGSAGERRAAASCCWLSALMDRLTLIHFFPGVRVLLEVSTSQMLRCWEGKVKRFQAGGSA